MVRCRVDFVLLNLNKYLDVNFKYVMNKILVCL